MIIISSEEILVAISGELSFRSLISNEDNYWVLVRRLYDYGLHESMIIRLMRLIVNKYGCAYHTSIYDLLSECIDIEDSIDKGVELFSIVFTKIYKWRYNYEND